MNIEQIRQAAGRIAGVACVTPLIENQALNERCGARIMLKLEILQRAGSFKFRGAYNRLVQLDTDQRRAGVVAFSSGNHAQGVALAASLLGIPATIVMPSDAPSVKITATKAYGASVRLYDRLTESREDIAAEIADAQNVLLVPAFDDPDIIAGQGTVGLEIVAQARAVGANLDVVCSPVSGGGLLGGICLALRSESPSTAIWGVEPSGFEDLRLSLEAGERVSIKPTGRSLCDSLESPAPGRLNFPILKECLAGAAAVTDAEVAEAVRYAFEVLKLVVEPGGAAGLAALLSGKVPSRSGGAVAIVISGGNVDPALYATLIGQPHDL